MFRINSIIFSLKNIFKITLLELLWFLYKIFKKTDTSVTVLMYHSIGDSGWEFSVTPKIFVRQIEYLYRNNFNFLTAGDLYDIISGKSKPSGKNVLLTFDDGYEDFILKALPVIKEYEAKAIVFVHTNRSPLPLKNDLPLMSPEQIKEIQMQGIEVGNHSHSHPNMKLLSEEALDFEIKTSTRILEQLTGERDLFFAYPSGKFNKSAVDALVKNGYNMAFTIDRGLAGEGDDLMKVKRNGISLKTTFLEFKLRNSPACGWYEKIVNILK